MSRGRDDRDPTLVRNQAALGASGATRWLVPAGILGAIAIVLFAFSIPIVPALAWIGIALQIALFASMCAAAALAAAGRYRSFLFAWLMLGMAVSALVLLLTILGIAWSGVPPAAPAG